MAWLYSFESKEIQKFIMRSDKLRDMVGGSELINQLCVDYLPATLNMLGIQKSKQFIIAKAAGWARIVFNDHADAQKLYKTWPLLVDRFAPGLQIVQSIVEISSGLPDAISQGSKVLRARRNYVASALQLSAHQPPLSDGRMFRSPLIRVTWNLGLPGKKQQPNEHRRFRWLQMMLSRA
jgi:hypothetical protein